MLDDAVWQPWDGAWQQSLYGPDGFYRRGIPVQHFRTSVHASTLMAEALARLARSSGLARVVDVGSGGGELLTALAAADPGLELMGLDVGVRPAALPDRVRWLTSPGGEGLPAADALAGCLSDALVVGHEWLDDVPCAVLEVDGEGRLRVVEVDAATGAERLGPDASAAELAWAARWWATDGVPPGARVEVGLGRDRAWAALVAASPGSLLLAVDYAHHRDDRPERGSLIGYRGGRACAPVPDGSCDVTAHVALDAVAAAGTGAGAAAGVLTTQRVALRALGVDARLPDASEATRDPHGYLTALGAATEAAELLDPAGLGGFGWLLQSTGAAVPEVLRQPVTGDWTGTRGGRQAGAP